MDGDGSWRMVEVEGKRKKNMITVGKIKLLLTDRENRVARYTEGVFSVPVFCVLVCMCLITFFVISCLEGVGGGLFTGGPS